MFKLNYSGYGKTSRISEDETQRPPPPEKIKPPPKPRLVHLISEEKITSVVRNIFKCPMLYEHQHKAVTTTLSGKDIIVKAGTSAGKSWCFQLPALITGMTTIVISPTTAIMKNQVGDLLKLGIRAMYIGHEASYEDNRYAANMKPSVLYMCPQTAMKWIWRPANKRFVDEEVCCFAIDEAHCVVEWGATFVQEYAQLKALRSEFPHIPMQALTATARKEDIEAIANMLDMKDYEVIYGPATKSRTSFKVVWSMNISQLLHHVRSVHGKRIVYCQTKKETDDVSRYLTTAGVRAEPHHGDVSYAAKQETVHAFEQGDLNVIVATKGYTMGVHVKGVNHIFTFGMTPDLNTLIQQAGRGGREDQTCMCTLFTNDSNMTSVRTNFVHSKDPQEYKRKVDMYDEMVGFVYAKGCRMQYIAKVYGDTNGAAVKCGICDNCEGSKKQPPITGFFKRERAGDEEETVTGPMPKKAVVDSKSVK